MTGQLKDFLVIGGSGFVGRAARRLGGARSLATYNAAPFPGGIQLDLTRPGNLVDRLPAGRDFSHALLLAAESRVDPCFAEPERTWALNVEAPAELARQLHRAGIRTVFSSSEYVFDGAGANYRESDEPAPTTNYGKQKLAAERAVAAAEPEALIVRFAKILGEEPDDGTLLTVTLKQLTGGEPVLAAEDQVFTPLFVDDLVRQLFAAMDRGLGGVYHAAGVETYSRYDLVSKLAGHWGGRADIRRVRLGDIPLKEPRPLDLSMDAGAFIEATGVRPVGMDELCARVVARGL